MTKLTTRTPKQVYNTWLEALRSGEYEQTQSTLRKYTTKHGKQVGTGFCCLGVLCDIAARDGGRQWVGDKFDGQDGEPPLYLTDYLGLSGSDISELIDLNDNEKKSFRYIARYIERNLRPAALKSLKEQVE